MRRLSILLSLTLLAALPATGGAVDHTQKPNFIVILTDDQRHDFMSCRGHPFLQTPHLDALASSGALFENAFVTTSLCSPSRASLLTGAYAHRHGVLDNSTELPAAMPSLPMKLQEAGYETAFIGKWHMGGGSDAPRPGFDHWVSFRGQGTYRNPELNVNGTRSRHEGYVTDLLTDYALEYLGREHRRPFLLCLWHKAVHDEFIPAQRHLDSYKDAAVVNPDTMADTEENYAVKPAWVRAQRNSWHGVDGMYDRRIDVETLHRKQAETLRAVDDSVGRVMETLRRLNLEEHTVVVFSSDNGFQLGEHGLVDKRTMYEESIRVPLLMSGPGIAKSLRPEALTLNIDLAPTLLEWAGAEVPETMQGMSLLPVLSGETAGWRKSFLYEYFWERSFPQTPTVLGVRTQTHKFMQFHGIWDLYELYDLRADPGEKKNLLADFRVTTRGGTLDNLIRQQAPDELRALFVMMHDELGRLLKETGCSAEPRW